MSERVEFKVKATPNRFAAYDYHVAQKGFCRNSIEAKKLAASLNAREEELRQLRYYCGNELARSDFRTATEMRAELERLRSIIKDCSDAILSGIPSVCLVNELRAADKEPGQ